MAVMMSEILLVAGATALIFWLLGEFSICRQHRHHGDKHTRTQTNAATPLHQQHTHHHSTSAPTETAAPDNHPHHPVHLNTLSARRYLGDIAAFQDDIPTLLASTLDRSDDTGYFCRAEDPGAAT
jgi:hypothetical protein